MRPRSRRFVLLRWAALLALAAPTPAVVSGAQAPAGQAPVAAPRPPAAQVPPEPRPSPKPQPRPHASRVTVDPRTIDMDDVDNVVIRWLGEEPEKVRILGIDTPETRHLEHDIPKAQEMGDEAAA